MYPDDKRKQIKIKLSKVQRITLSNKDLRGMYTELKPRLMRILFEFTDEEIESINQLDKDTENREINATDRNNDMVKLPLSTEHWKCSLIISMENIMEIRSMVNGSDVDFMNGHNTIYNNLMLRKLTADHSINQESDEEDPFKETKKNFKVKYRAKYILPIPLNIHVSARS